MKAKYEEATGKTVAPEKKQEEQERLRVVAAKDRAFVNHEPGDDEEGDKPENPWLEE